MAAFEGKRSDKVTLSCNLEKNLGQLNEYFPEK